MITFSSHPNYKLTVNVLKNGKETRFAVRKSVNYYSIEYWYKGAFRSFNSSWYSSKSKSEIKEKLEGIISNKIEVDPFSSHRMRVAA